MSREKDFSGLKHVAMLLSRGFYPDPRVYKEARCLVEAGHQVTILAWDRQCRFTENERVDGIRIERIRMKAGIGEGASIRQGINWIIYYRTLIRKIRAGGFDVIHCHDLDTLPAGFYAAKRLGIPVVFDAHEPDYYAYWPKSLSWLVAILRQAERYMAKHSHHVIVTNQYQIDKYRSWGVERVSLVANYPETSLILEGPFERTRKEEFVFARIGVIYQDTGVEEILQAFLPISKEFPNARLMLIGRVLEGFQSRFDTLVKDFNDQVILMGEYHYNELPEIYRKIDVAILTYRKSSWFRNITPTKFFEALARGVPVIATEIGGIGEIIRESGCGIVLPDADVPSIQEAMRYYLTHPDELSSMGEKGLAQVRQKYNWNPMMERLRKLYV